MTPSFMLSHGRQSDFCSCWTVYCCIHLTNSFSCCAANWLINLCYQVNNNFSLEYNFTTRALKIVSQKNVLKYYMLIITNWYEFNFKFSRYIKIKDLFSTITAFQNNLWLIKIIFQTLNHTYQPPYHFCT